MPTSTRAQEKPPNSALPLGLATLALLVVSPVAAQDELPRIEVTLQPGCGDLDEAVVRRVLAVELGEHALLGGEDPDAQVVVACATPIVALTLTERDTDRRLARELEIDAATGRSRLVALAISELIAASWIVADRRPDARPVIEPHEVIETPVETPPVLPPPPTPIEPNAAGVRIFGVAQISGEPFHFSGGGGLGFDTLLIEPVALAMDARVTRGSISADPGSIDLTGVTLGAFVALRAPFERSHADIGVGVRGGVGILEGHGADGVGGQLLIGPIVSIAGTTLVSLHLIGTAYAHVGIELGWTIAGVTGTLATTGEALARLGGAYISVSVGFEVRPGR